MKHVFRPKYNLSQEGLMAIKAKLAELENQRLIQIENLRTLKGQQSIGLSLEDSSYIEAMDRLRHAEEEINKCQSIIAHAKILKRSRRSTKVGLGSRVRLKSGNKEIEYIIVQSIEADPSIGKISDESPLGRQLIGKTMRDRISLKTLRGKIMSFHLVGIS